MKQGKKPRDRILRKPELQTVTGLSDSTIARMEKAGEFPERIPLGGNSVGWLESEVLAWLEMRMAQRADRKELLRERLLQRRKMAAGGLRKNGTPRLGNRSVRRG